MKITDPVGLEILSRAIGTELRRAREALGMSRAKFVLGLPCGIGERTLVAYEHGLRNISVVRLVELCEHLNQSAPDLLARALQNAKLHLANMTLRVDVRKVINGRSMKFRPMVAWARNRLNDAPDGIIALTPSAIRELAAFVGQRHDDLARYLSNLGPDVSPLPETA